MSRRRSRSALFPYTTLFRSVGAGVPVPAGHECDLAGQRAAEHAVGSAPGGAGIGNLDLDDCVGRVAGAQDRKSTRLNSSHGSISYAVLCLKKKSLTEPEPDP